VQAGVKVEIKALAERFNLPVVLTPMAKGLLAEDHAAYAGVLFHALSDIVGQTHQQADLVLAIGYDPVEFNLESWMPAAPLINIDVAPVDIDREKYRVPADVTGDIPASLNYFLELPAERKDWDLQALAQRRAAMFAKLAPTPDQAFGPKAALAILREALPANGIMTCDVGAHTHLIGQQWRTPEPKLQLMTNGWSSMGFGIPAAIAAKLARPDRTVCAVLGDGGFLMTVGELATAARLNLRIVFVLLTDNDLALIRIKQEKKHHPIYGTVVRTHGTIGAQNLFGVPVTTATTREEFRTQLAAAFEQDGPTLVEAVIDSREYDSVVLKRDKP
jgi:acetolactate synthase-1/2/3 large subunit